MHILVCVKQVPDTTVVLCQEKPCTDFCPARVYEYKDDKIVVGFEGCLECGACRIACPHNNVDWNYPRAGFGIQFRLA